MYVRLGWCHRLATGRKYLAPWHINPSRSTGTSAAKLTGRRTRTVFTVRGYTAVIVQTNTTGGVIHGSWPQQVHPMSELLFNWCRVAKHIPVVVQFR